MNIRGCAFPYVVSVHRWTSFNAHSVELYRTEQEALRWAKSHAQQPGVESAEVWLHTPDTFGSLELLWTTKKGKVKLVRPYNWDRKK